MPVPRLNHPREIAALPAVVRTAFAIIIVALTACSSERPPPTRRSCVVRAEAVRSAFAVPASIEILEDGQVNRDPCPSTFWWKLPEYVAAGAYPSDSPRDNSDAWANVALFDSFAHSHDDAHRWFEQERAAGKRAVPGLGTAAHWSEGVTGSSGAEDMRYQVLVVFDQAEDRIVEFRGYHALRADHRWRPAFEALARSALPFQGTGPMTFSPPWK